MTTHAQGDDFDIGKAVFDQLKDLAPERQQRVLRWVAEGLGVSLGATAAQPAHTGFTTPPTPAAPTAPLPSGSGMDIKSFVAAKEPKSDNQFAAAVAYFYRFEASPAERRDSIDGAALQEAARLAGRKRLGDPRKTLNNAKAAGYLDSTAPGEFAINSVGENLVAMALPGGVDASTRRARKAKIKKGTPKRGRRAKKG